MEALRPDRAAEGRLWAWESAEEGRTGRAAAQGEGGAATTEGWDLEPRWPTQRQRRGKDRDRTIPCTPRQAHHITRLRATEPTRRTADHLQVPLLTLTPTRTAYTPRHLCRLDSRCQLPFLPAYHLHHHHRPTLRRLHRTNPLRWSSPLRRSLSHHKASRQKRRRTESTSFANTILSSTRASSRKAVPRCERSLSPRSGESSTDPRLSFPAIEIPNLPPPSPPSRTAIHD